MKIICTYICINEETESLRSSLHLHESILVYVSKIMHQVHLCFTSCQRKHKRASEAGCFCSRWDYLNKNNAIGVSQAEKNEWQKLRGAEFGRGTSRIELKRRERRGAQWNNSPYNRFDISYMPEDSKHCVIIYKWLCPYRHNTARRKAPQVSPQTISK